MHSDNSERQDRLAFIQTMGELASISLVHTEYGACPSGKVAFVPHATPPVPPLRQLCSGKSLYGWEGKKVVGMIGYPDWYKRYDRVVRLWPEIAERVGSEALLVAACAPRPGSKEGVVLGDALSAGIAASPARESIVDMPKLFSPTEFLEVVAREVKRRNESIEAYEDAGRDDLVKKETEERQVLQVYMPQQLSDAEVDALVAEAIEQTGASSVKELGKVMGYVMGKAKGRVDGNVVQQKARARLGA